MTMEIITEEQLAKELRTKYIKNPPEGMTSSMIKEMSDNELLDMDYFLHEEDIDFGGNVKKAFISSNSHYLNFLRPLPRKLFFIPSPPPGELSY